MHMSPIFINLCLLIVLTLAACPHPYQIPEQRQSQESSYIEPPPKITDDKRIVDKFGDLVRVCMHSTYCEDSHLFVYRGKDITRRWKDYYNCSNPDEVRYLKDFCNKIKQFFNDLENIEYDEVLRNNHSSQDWRILEVSITKKGGIIKKYFCFLKIGNEYGLADIRDRLE